MNYLKVSIYINLATKKHQIILKVNLCPDRSRDVSGLDAVSATRVQ